MPLTRSVALAGTSKEITLLENEQQKDIAKRDELLKNLKKLNQFMV